MNNNYVPPKDPTPPATSDFSAALIPVTLTAALAVLAGRKKRL